MREEILERGMWLHRVALDGGDGAWVTDSVMYFHLPTLCGSHRTKLKQSFKIGWDADPREIRARVVSALPGPQRNADHQGLQDAATARQRPLAEFVACEALHAPELFLLGLLRAPEAIADQADHWVRQALHAANAANSGKPPTDTGVYVHCAAHLVIHWGRRAAAEPYRGSCPHVTTLARPNFAQWEDDEVRAEKALAFEGRQEHRRQALRDRVHAFRLTNRSPMLRAQQSVGTIAALFEANPVIRAAVLKSTAPAYRAALGASPWSNADCCSVLDIRALVEAIDEGKQQEVSPRRPHEFRVYLREYIYPRHYSDGSTDDTDLRELASITNSWPSPKVTLQAQHRKTEWAITAPGFLNSRFQESTPEEDLEEFQKILRDNELSSFAGRLRHNDWVIIGGTVFFKYRAVSLLGEVIPKQRVFFESLKNILHDINTKVLNPRQPKMRLAIPREQRLATPTRAKRGLSFTPAEDAELRRFFGLGPNGRIHLTEAHWQQLLACLPMRTRSSIEGHLAVYNAKLRLEYKVKYGRKAKEMYERDKLAQARGPKKGMPNPLNRKKKTEPAEPTHSADTVASPTMDARP